MKWFVLSKWFNSVIWGSVLLLSISCSKNTDTKIAVPAGGESGTNDEKLSVLIVDGFSNHNWQVTTSIVQGLLEESGLFTVDVSTAPETAEADGWDSWRPTFADYDVVVQNCNDIRNGPSWPKEVQESFEHYVAHGGGLYVLHSGNNAFPEWEAYNRIIGLGWRTVDFGYAITIEDDGRINRIPAGEGEKTSHGPRFDAVLTRHGNHPIHVGLPARWMAADLEVYRYARGPAENLTVLSYAKDPKTQLNFPTEWVVEFGKGKVYNSTFGHIWHNDSNPPGARCVAFQTMLVRAVEWLGRGVVTSEIPGDFPNDRAVSLVSDLP